MCSDRYFIQRIGLTRPLQDIPEGGMMKLTILQINDTHSYLELHNEHFYGSEGIEVNKLEAMRV